MKVADRLGIDGMVLGTRELQQYCTVQSRDKTMPPWKREVYRFIQHFLDPHINHINQKTSGTTGDPSLHQLFKDSMNRSARRTLDHFELQKSDDLLLCLPVHYVAGKMQVVRALVGGLNLVMVEPSGRPLKALSREVNFGAMVPLQVHESIKHNDDLTLVKKLIVGGGELHPLDRAVLQKGDVPEAFESFAMTETYTHFALKRLNGQNPDTEFKLMAGVVARLDHRGCLEVDVPGITRGYVSTNDMVAMNNQGNGFLWKGRYDHVINSGGIKIIPELLEDKMSTITGCPCILLAENDEKLGQRLVLMVELPGGKSAPTGGSDIPVNASENRWKQMMKEVLSPHEIPRRIVVVEQIPRNNVLKPDRIRAAELLGHL